MKNISLLMIVWYAHFLQHNVVTNFNSRCSLAQVKSLLFFQVMSGSMSFDNLSSLMRTSESFSDLNAELNPLRGRNSNSGSNSVPGKATNTSNTSEEASNKPFGLGKKTSIVAQL